MIGSRVLRLLGKVKAAVRSRSSVAESPFALATPMIATPVSPQISVSSFAPGVPRNVAKAVVNCARKGRNDLAEAVLRNCGYADARVSMISGVVTAHTAAGLMTLNVYEFPEP